MVSGGGLTSVGTWSSWLGYARLPASTATAKETNMEKAS